MNFFFLSRNEQFDLFSFKWYIKFQYISFSLLYFVYGGSQFEIRNSQWRTYHRTKGSVSPQMFEKKYSKKSYSLAENNHKPIRMLFRLLFPFILYLQLIMHLNDKIHNFIYLGPLKFLYYSLVLFINNKAYIDLKKFIK